MTVYYLLLFAAVVLLALQFAMNKLYQSQNGSALLTSLLYTTLTGLACGIIFLAVNGFRLHITPFSLLCACGIAGLCLGYNLLGFRIFSLGSFSVYTMFLMLGGMLLPFLYGMLFLGDTETLSSTALGCRIAGVLLLALSLVFPCFGGKRDSGNKRSRTLFLFLCLCVFFMNGFVSILSKVHQIADPAVISDSGTFVFLTNTINGAVSGLLLLILCRKKHKKPELSAKFSLWKLAAVVLGCALFNGTSYLLQLKVAASPLPASVQYPMITGGSVILSAAAGFLFFREKPDRWQFAGLSLAFAATFLFLF